MKKYLIIGGSIAGVSCVEGIRSRDEEGEITLVTAEPFSNYGRPLISYYLEGKTDVKRMSWRGEDFFEKNRVDVRHAVTAEKLEPEAKRVLLSTGEALPYDAFCLCLGSHPFSPRFEGVETVENRFFFTTLSDALALEKTVTKTSRVLVVGAGFIGLKCAEGLRDRAASVTVCDLAEHAMSANLDADCAPILERHLAENGLRLMLGDTVTRFEGQTAHMKSGKDVGFDVLVIAIGTRPNVSLLAEAGGSVGKGILVGEGMETSLPGVWAAGDCTESMDVSAGTPGLLAVLPNASLQGFCAGANMAGGSEKFDKGIKMNSIGFFGLHIMSAGSYDGERSEIRRGDVLKRFFVKDGYLGGYMLIGETDRAGIYTALVREKTPLSEIDFEAAKESAGSRIFSSNVRRKKFGGAV